MTTFSETYRNKSNDDLLRLAEEKDSLQDAARQALEFEMQKRGLGESDVAHLEIQDREATERVEEPGNVRRGIRSNWVTGILGNCLIFGIAAILAAVVADYVLKPPSKFAELQGQMSLKIAIALGLLAHAFGSRWMTIKRTVIAGVLFSVVLFGCFFGFWVASQHADVNTNAYSQHADVSTNAVRYDGNGFSMTIPAGSTPVQVERETKVLSGQQVAQSSYIFRNGRVVYRIGVGDFSGHVGGTPDEASKSVLSQTLDPGYHTTNSMSHLGTLPAAASEAVGTRQGVQMVLKIRAAYSADYKRAWIVIVICPPDSRSFPVAQVDAFMDSIQIN